MNLNPQALQKLLCERLCENVGVEQRADGELMLQSYFQFPDGDHYPIYLSKAESGGLRLSDRGHTLMHLSYEHDVDSFLDGTRGMLLENIMGESGLQWDKDGGAFCLDTSPESLSENIFQFGQALTRVYDLSLLSRSRVGSVFYDDLKELLSNLLDEDRFQRDYQPDVPNASAYLVDYRIECQDNVPLFLYGIPNLDKARLTTIMLSHFHRHELSFNSILIFENQAEIPRKDLARLSDVGGDMISSLEASEDFERKLGRYTAA